MKKSSVVELNQWKHRANLIAGATKSGWNITKGELSDPDNAVSFYICEPLKTGYAAMGVYSRKSLASLVRTGTKKYGSKNKVFEVVAHFTMDLIASKSDNHDLLDTVLTGNIINFAGTQTANVAIKDSTYRHFGAIIYHNPHRPDGVHVTFRPMVLSQPDAVLDPEVLCPSVSSYMLDDQKKHPEYFEGLDIVEVVTTLYASMGVTL